MKVSPIRNPLKPASRNCLNVSGCEMPLSDTHSSSFGNFRARRNEFSTSV